MDEESLRSELVSICRKLIIYNLTYASLGNVSVRAGNFVLITPSGVRFDLLRPAEIVKVNLEGNVIGNGRPSVELSMHLEIYKSIPSAGAIIHAHAPYSTVLGSVMGDITFPNEEAKVFHVEKIPVCPAAPSGTTELAKNVANSLRNSKATIIPNHGVVVYGRNLHEALSILEIIENLSKMRIIGLFLKKIVNM